MKIRFYHWWIYRLYYKYWTPILATHPDMVRAQVQWMSQWLENFDKDIDDIEKL